MVKRKRSRAEAHPLRNDITTELSPDIVFEQILPRLPVKSVLRFTCVSKQWHSFLKTPMFAKMHRRQCRHVITNKLVVVSATTKLFHTIDCDRPKEGFSAGRPFPFKVEPYQHIRILASVRGLRRKLDQSGKLWPVMEQYYSGSPWTALEEWKYAHLW
ncbi:hypothetical protein L2E82_37940 [Cichorium intybus]|uniref:Uncharacterized protein n=1 Tax=Cichorium intybus TaxID=13427 RepID=A0ACB9AF33_CICIN|nr:hypothetical protein L2E82_37940 [Cichorium intybus]